MTDRLAYVASSSREYTEFPFTNFRDCPTFNFTDNNPQTKSNQDIWLDISL